MAKETLTIKAHALPSYVVAPNLGKLYLVDENGDTTLVTGKTPRAHDETVTVKTENGMRDFHRSDDVTIKIHSCFELSGHTPKQRDALQDTLAAHLLEQHSWAPLASEDHKVLEELTDNVAVFVDDITRRPTAAVSKSRPRGHWMQTFTGRQFFPMEPRPEEIDRLDIAHALSMIARYNGHAKHFYSVAEHCVHLSYLVPTEHALWALLHDATEAYVGDMIRPLKAHMKAYCAAEDRVMLAIAEHFDMDQIMPEEVKRADTRILLDERAALFDTWAGDWRVEGEPFGIAIHAWSPAEAKQRYLNRLAELTDSLTSS